MAPAYHEPPSCCSTLPMRVLTPSGLIRHFDPIEVRSCSHVERAADNRRRRHVAVVELVPSQELKPVTGCDDGRDSFLVEEMDTTVGVDDQARGARVAAALVLRGSASWSELASHCRARLDEAGIPRHWLFVNAIPLTLEGKADVPLLRQQLLGERPRVVPTSAAECRSEPSSRQVRHDV